MHEFFVFQSLFRGSLTTTLWQGMQHFNNAAVLNVRNKVSHRLNDITVVNQKYRLLAHNESAWGNEK